MESIREENIQIDLYRQNYIPLKLKQYDTTKLNFNINKNGVATDLTGNSFVLNFIKGDTTLVVQTSGFDTTQLSSGKVGVTLVEDCLRAYGEGKIELQILKDGKLISNFVLPCKIEGSVIDNTIPSSNLVTLTEELNQTIQEGINTKEDLENVIATADTTTYATKGEINEVNSSLEEKANVNEVRPKTVKLVMEDMADSVIGAISGGATVNVLSVPQDKSVTPLKTTFIRNGKNLFNKNTALKDKGIVYTNGNLWNKVGAYASDFIEIVGGKTYVLSGTTEQLAFYNSDKVYISGLADGLALKDNPVPSNAKFVRIMVANATQLEITQLELGSVATRFEPYTNIVDESIVNANTKAETERLIQSGLKNKSFAHIGTKLSKYGKVLGAGASGQWDDGCVESPVIWFDENTQRYAMCYVGYKRVVENGVNLNVRPQVGLAWSDDLLLWEKDSRNPIFGYTGAVGDFDKEGTTGPYIHYENGTYFLYYIGLDEYGYEKGTKRLGLATSTDLYTWTRYSGNPIISPNGVGWSGSQIWHIHLVKEKSKYYIFFNASGFPVNEFGTPRERIGIAWSNDLYNWTVDRTAPLIDIGGSSEWDSDQVFDPSIYKVNNIWYMAYAGAHSESGNSTACDGMAWTTEADFPYNWRKYSKNPILKPTVGFIDELYAHKPFIFQTQSCHYHYYTASTIGERCIALAYQNLGVQSRKTQTILCQEIDRTVSATSLSSLSNSSFLFNIIGKKDLEFRVMIRANLKGNTLQLSDASMSPGTVDTFTGATWDNYVTTWRKVSISGTNPRYNYTRASVNANSAIINLLVYEFRWNEE